MKCHMPSFEECPHRAAYRNCDIPQYDCFLNAISSVVRVNMLISSEWAGGIFFSVGFLSFIHTFAVCQAGIGMHFRWAEQQKITRTRFYTRYMARKEEIKKLCSTMPHQWLFAINRSCKSKTFELNCTYTGYWCMIVCVW